jgi:hypothetical protein
MPKASARVNTKVLVTDVKLSEFAESLTESDFENPQYEKIESFFNSLRKETASCGRSEVRDNPAVAQLRAYRARLRREARQHLRRFLHSKLASDEVKYQETRRQWLLKGREISKELGRLYAAEFRDALKDQFVNPKRVWDKINPGRKSQAQSCPINLSTLETHFKELNYKDVPNLTMPSTQASDSLLDAIITEEEVSKAILSRDSSKAPGSDRVTNSHWKMFFKKPLLHSFLTAVLNSIYSSGLIPTEWRLTEVFVLYKGKGTMTDPNSYRGIALTQSVLKIFESILVKRLTEWAERKNLIPICQAGFRSGYSTNDHVFTLRYLQKKYFKTQSGLYNK